MLFCISVQNFIKKYEVQLEKFKKNHFSGDNRLFRRFLAQWCKTAMPKMWCSPFFEKKFFRAKMPEICRKNRFFGIFSRFHHQFFLIFSIKMRIIALLKTWSRPIFEKKSFPAENPGNMPEIVVFTDFVRTFSLYFVVFSLKNITNNNAHH